MINLKDLIKELSFTPLYHTTRSFDFAKQIISQDTLGKPHGLVSTTRNKKFGIQVGPVTFVLSREKLVKNYKVEPYIFGARGKLSLYGNEAEEKIDKPIKPLLKYLEWIEVIRPIKKEDYDEFVNFVAKHYPNIPVKLEWPGRIVESANQKYIGYKIVGWDSARKRAFSLFDTKTTYQVSRGAIHKSDKGLYLGTTKDFVVNYYSGQTDYDDMLLKCEYTENDIIKGSPHENGEIVVRQYKIIATEVIKNEYI